MDLRPTFRGVFKFDLQGSSPNTDLTTSRAYNRHHYTYIHTICIYEYINICMYVYICICLYVYIYIFLYLCTHRHICISICVYIYTHTYIRTDYQKLQGSMYAELRFCAKLRGCPQDGFPRHECPGPLLPYSTSLN